MLVKSLQRIQQIHLSTTISCCRWLSTFYDSQSGQYMTVSSQVQLHCRLSPHLTKQSFQTLLVEKSHVLSSIEFPIDWLQSYSEMIVKPSWTVYLDPGQHCSSTGNNKPDLSISQTLFQQMNIPQQLQGLCFHFDTDKYTNVSDWEVVDQLIVAKQEFGVSNIRVNVHTNDLSDVYTLADTMASLADHGVNSIILYSKDKIDNDELEELLVNAFGIDIEGIGMRDRIGIDFTNNEEAEVHALEVSAIRNLRVDSRRIDAALKLIASHSPYGPIPGSS